jgi:hypothetical protein
MRRQAVFVRMPGLDLPLTPWLKSSVRQVGVVWRTCGGALATSPAELRLGSGDRLRRPALTKRVSYD